ncbi:MAG TPA: hypothetical protein VFV30_01725 [Novosphingobium sp.]|nr:hypothetical protein [Novosphingobium sp.]
MNPQALLDELPIERRLAMAYAPAAARPLTLGLFALDTRLAGIVRQASEPLLGQIRLAWWREQLAADPASTPRGEPLLALLADWGARRAALSSLVDGWEALLGGDMLLEEGLERFVHARGAAAALLAQALEQDGVSAEAEQAGRAWAAAELAVRLSDPAERAMALRMAGAADWGRIKLPRALRPLAVLHGLARRKKGQGALLSGPVDMLVAARLGLTGF